MSARFSDRRLTRGLFTVSLGWAALIAPSGCTGPEPVAPGGPSTPAGWVAEVVADPALFTTLMEGSGREGWILLHANELDGARVMFTDTPSGARSKARADLELAVLHGDLARMSAEAHDRLFRSWDRRGTLPAASAAPAIAALAARCTDKPWKPWADRVPKGPGAALVATFESPDALWPAEAPAAGTPAGDDPMVARRVAHTRARAGQVSELLQVAQVPLIVEPAEGFERTFWDPCVHETLAEAWMLRATEDLGAGGQDWREALLGLAAPDAGLESRLFAPWLTNEDLREELVTARDPGVIGATMPSLVALGIPRTPTPGDDIDVARDEARALGEVLAGWREGLRSSGSADGQALLQDLRLIERFRQEWLVSRARLALLEERPRQALAYLQLARDVVDPAVGPANSPSVLALLAEAELRNGHTREALDALRILHDAHPEVLGLQEVVGDLAVLEGLDRSGDSKEN